MKRLLDILGLKDMPKDFAQLRKAYAAKLKSIDAQENPQDFMALREAYDHIGYVLQHGDMTPVQSVTPVDVPLDEASDVEIDLPPQVYRSEYQGVLFSDKYADYRYHAEPEPFQKDVFSVLQQVADLLEHEKYRNIKANWKNIFDSEKLEPIENSIMFERLLRDYFLSRFGFYDGDSSKSNRNQKPQLINGMTGTYICDRMQWRDNSMRSEPEYSQINFLKQDLDCFNMKVKRQVGAYGVIEKEVQEDSIWEYWYIPVLLLAIVQLLRYLTDVASY